jgi:amino acid adenylation domain-containing protein
VVGALRERASQFPNKTALRFLGDRDDDVLSLNFAQVDRGARAVAAHLQALGATGERALVLHPPGPAYSEALLGCFYAGVIAVPAYPPRFNRSVERLRDIVIDADAKFALTTASALEKIARNKDGEPRLAALQWIATDLIDPAQAELWRPLPADENAVAFLQYTSGSTGAPKGVVLSHRNLLANMVAITEAMQVTEADSGVSWLPPYHDMGLIGTLLLPLCIGCEVTLLTPAAFLQRPMRWLQAMSDYRATITAAPNFAFELCLRRISAEQIATLNLRAWRVALCGAERVRADTMQRFEQAFAPAGFRRSAFTPCYGLAEATLAVTFSTIDAPPTAGTLGDMTLVSCGRPLGGVEVAIVDPQTCERQAADVVGEIWVRAPCVARGYWKKSELTADVFDAAIATEGPAGGSPKLGAGTGYLRTGDLGFLRDGELYVAGRIKDLIILRGINHYAEDVEAAIDGGHPRLRLGGAAAFAVDEDSEERLVVVHEVDSIRDLPLREIADAIKTRIALSHDIMVHAVVLLPPGGLPKTSSGKVQRRRTRELYLSGELPSLGAPLNDAPSLKRAPPEMVRRVAALMAELLGMQSIGDADDFFWLGGHSLLAIQLTSRIHEAFGVELPLRTVFDAKTPQALAALIAAAPAAPALPPVQPVDRSGRLPLSFSQERMWFLHRLDPASPAYNVAGAVLLEGSLDVDAMRRSFEEIIKRHEVLRTNYPTIDGEPHVRIAASLVLPIAVVDLSNSPRPMDAAMAAASVLARRPFDLGTDALLRVALYRVAPQTHVLCASMHHMVTDAWSLGLLVADMLKFYDAFAAGAVPAAASVDLSYVDFAAWQRRYLTEDYLRRQLVYWKAQLAGATPIDLPTDRPRAQRQSSAGAHQPMALSNELMDGLVALAAAQGTTLFMLMLAAFEVLLYRYTGNTDLVVGVPVANRNSRASESVMGSLVNTLALRLRFDADASFADLLQQVRSASLDAYSHQDLPFERLVAELAVERRPGESPIINVMFDFQNAPMPGRGDREPRMTPVMLSRGAAQFDLALLVMNTDFGRTAGVEYNTDLFDAATIERLTGHYHSILEAVVLNPTESIAKIPLLTRAERVDLLQRSAAACDVAVPFESVPAGFTRHARKSPRAPAIIDAQGTLSYAELEYSANQLAAQLLSRGAGPGARVAIFMERDRHLIIALLATMKAGAAYVPIDPAHPQDRVAYVIADAEPRVLLTQLGLRGLLPEAARGACLCLDDPGDAPPMASAGAPAAAADESDAAYVMYTSGSTGRPKGVEVSAGALGTFLHSMRHTPGIETRDRMLAVTTVAFDIAGLEIWLPLTSGACVHLATAAESGDGRELLALMQRRPPTIMQATPATWAMLIEAGWKGDRQLKILCGGEALSESLAQELLVRAGSVWNMYGPTETTIWSTVHRVRAGDTAPIPIGTPIDRTRIYILDRHGELAPLGVAGEIHIGGAGVANGYLNRPDLTGERFLADPFAVTESARMYRTGDAGRLRGGLLEYRGRLDAQIKLRGFRIEPGEIETVLKQHDSVLDALVMVRENRRGEPALAAYVIPAPESAPSAAVLQEWLRRQLPEFMIPTAFVPLAAFPKTANGKIDRKLLPAADEATAMAAPEIVEPRDDLERLLARMWSDILGVSRPGIRDNFFLLGGHSLLAVRLFARIERQFRVALPLSILHERPTIEYLAESIRDCESRLSAARGRASAPADGFSHIVPIQRRGKRPILFCVHGAGGNVLNLASIARHLGDDRPFIGLQALGTDGISDPLQSIEAMAAEYIREMRGLQPKGPYFLSGYCGGGIVAFEMAKILRESGESVAMLTLIDCYLPGVPVDNPRRHWWKRGTLNARWRYLWRAADAKIRRDYVSMYSALRVQWFRLRGRSIPYELRDFWLTRAFLRAAAGFRPRIYPGRLTLLRATGVEAALLNVGSYMGWSKLAAGGVETFDVPGNHYTIMDEPNVTVLASMLKRCLETAELARQP